MPTKIIRLVFTSLRIVILMVVIFLVVFFFFNFRVEFEERDIDRAGIEIKDALVNNLTIQLGVFNKFDLQELNGKDIEPIRHCRYPYKVTIENLETKEKLSFGHDPGKLDIIRSGIVETEVGIAEPVLSAGDIDENIIRPARMKIDVYDTWLGTTTCMIENSYKQKTIIEERFTCPDYIKNEYENCGFPLRNKGGDTNSDYVCLFIVDANTGEKIDLECRYLPDIIITENYQFFPPDDKKNVKVVPLDRFVPSQQILPNVFSCRDLQRYIAAPDEEVRSIALCFEDILQPEPVPTPPPTGTPPPP